jgi:hypothetical protein
MALALGATAIVALVLLSELGMGRIREPIRRCRETLARRREKTRRAVGEAYDPGRELRAERRARALLRSCVNDDEWAMYRDLGFLRVWGAFGARDRGYAYLIYPHKPIVAYLPETGVILNEYCVALTSQRSARALPRLPGADDVLAKWMLLTADERRLLEQANMHMPGRQLDPGQVRRDLLRLSQWERAREAERPGHARGAAVAGHFSVSPADRTGGVPAR